MKRFIYSKYTKFIAAVIFVACIVLGALTATTGINYLMTYEKDMIYQFEDDFSDSRHLKHLLYEPENLIFNAYHNFYNVEDDKENVTKTEPLTINGQTLEQNIEQRLNDMWCKDKIHYYIKWNDRVFTNCGASSPEELNQNKRGISKDECIKYTSAKFMFRDIRDGADHVCDRLSSREER